MTEPLAIEQPVDSNQVSDVVARSAELARATVAARASDPTLPRVLTPDELAKVLRVRRRSVYEAISRGDIPGVRRIGRKVRIDRDSVLAWMADGHGRAPRSSRR